MPGEIRFWSETFKTERPEMLERAFREYLRLGKFFPKPADISETIARLRAAMPPQASSNKPSREETEREQNTPEWQEANRRLRERLARIAGRKVMA